MVDHSLTVAASHVARLYLWDMMRKYMGDIWYPIKGRGDAETIPIVAAQEQPELQASENPYIVYAYDILATTDLWQIQQESMALTIFTQSPARLSATSKLCVRLFNRRDESARDINRWLRNAEGLLKYETGDSQYDKWIDEFQNFRFLTTSVPNVQSVQPARGEAGRVDGTVTIDLKYVERNADRMFSNN